MVFLMLYGLPIVFLMLYGLAVIFFNALSVVFFNALRSTSGVFNALWSISDCALRTGDGVERAGVVAMGGMNTRSALRRRRRASNRSGLLAISSKCRAFGLRSGSKSPFAGAGPLDLDFRGLGVDPTDL